MTEKINKKDLFKKIQEIFKEKKIKLRSEEKYNLDITPGDIYPDYINCENYQNVWLDDSNYIQIKYINHNKFIEKIKEYEKFEKEKKNKNYKFQNFEDNDLTMIQINFKKEDTMFALDILIEMIELSVGDEDSLSVKLGKTTLPIKVKDIPSKYKWKSIDDYFVSIENENLFIELIKEEIKDEMTFYLIITDRDSFYPIAEKCFSYEHYNYDEYYLYNKERRRIEKIINK